MIWPLWRGADGRRGDDACIAARRGCGYDPSRGFPGATGRGKGWRWSFGSWAHFEVVGSTGLVNLRGAKRRGLLACLAVNAGRPMTTDRLVEELWGDGGTDGAVRTVQMYVSQLRQLLRDEEVGLLTRPGGYVLEIDPADVDAYRFERALTASFAE
jgi:two-component SAPR family response regulator